MATTKLPLAVWLVLTVLQLHLARCQHYDDQPEYAYQALLGKQQRNNDRQVYNITWLWTTPASAVPNELPIVKPSAENSTEPVQQQHEKLGTVNTGQQRRQRQNKSNSRRRQTKEDRQKDRAKEEVDIAGIRSDLMREFATKHGERIRRSRRYADLFDGSGYLLDHMEELRQYQSRAEEHRNRHRQRRSTDNSQYIPIEDFFDTEELPKFDSLTELLEHLNDGPQGDIILDGINLRFVEEKPINRRKRSNSEDDENNPSREKEAEESIQRLDTMLQDLATYLDQEHMDAAEDAQDSDSDSQQQSPPLLAGFNKQLSGAHKALLQLREMLITATASGRMSSMHAMPHKNADWRVNSELLRHSVQQLRQIYRQMDEL